MTTTLRLRRYGWTSGTSVVRTAETLGDVLPYVDAYRPTINQIEVVQERDAGSVKRSPMQIGRIKNEECSIRDLGRTKQDYTYAANHVGDDAVSAATKHYDLLYAVLYWWRGASVASTANPRLVTMVWGAPGDYDYETFTGSIIGYNYQRVAGEDKIAYTLTLMKGVDRSA